MTAEFHFDNDRCYQDKIGILNETLSDIIPKSYTYMFSNLTLVKRYCLFLLTMLHQIISDSQFLYS